MNDLLQFADLELGDISYGDFFVGFFFSLILGLFVKHIYEKYSLSITNKKTTSNLYPIFSISIFVIVVTIKSSIVLSLGLVGALSIIRFRTAIKDAEQLVYLLIITAISISLAAYAYLFSIVLAATLYIYARISYYKEIKSFNSQNDSIILKLRKLEEENINEIINFFKKYVEDFYLESIRKTKESATIHFKCSNINEELIVALNMLSNNNDNFIEYQIFNSLD